MSKKTCENCVSRLREAFWLVLERKAYAQITVSDILSEAKVSRGDFYYHYENLRGLGEDAVRGEAEKWTSFISLLPDFKQGDSEFLAKQLSRYLSSISKYGLFKAGRLPVLLSPNGNMHLLKVLKEEFRSCLIEHMKERMGIDYNGLSNSQKLLTEGAIGFATSVMVHRDLLKGMDSDELGSLSSSLVNAIYELRSNFQ